LGKKRAKYFKLKQFFLSSKNSRKTNIVFRKASRYPIHLLRHESPKKDAAGSDGRRRFESALRSVRADVQDRRAAGRACAPKAPPRKEEKKGKERRVLLRERAGQ